MGLRAGLAWCGKSHPTGIRSPNRPARRQSLYRLRHPAPNEQITGNICVPDVAVSHNVLETVNSGNFVCNLDLPNTYFGKYLFFNL